MAAKILIVDDEVDSLKLIGLMLKRNGYDVIVAESGGKGLMRAESENPDLVILDVMMPDMDGLEVCRRLRDNPKTSEIPIIMFTAKTLIDDKVKGFEAGADDYLTKPTHPGELASRVQNVLQRKSASHQPTQQDDKKTPTAQKRGMLVGVLGVKGGMGTSTLALNLAAALKRANENPFLTDLLPGNSSLALMTGVPAGMAAVLKQETINPVAIQQATATYGGFKVLASSADLRETQLDLSVSRAVTLLRYLRLMGNPVIVDLGNQLSPFHAQILSEFDRLLYVIEANTLTLAMARLQLRELDEITGGRISIVVINRSVATLPWHEAENKLKREVSAMIAPAPELAFKALEERKPMIVIQPDAMVSGQFHKLAADIKTWINSMRNG